MRTLILLIGAAAATQAAAARQDETGKSQLRLRLSRAEIEKKLGEPDIVEALASCWRLYYWRLGTSVLVSRKEGTGAIGFTFFGENKYFGRFAGTVAGASFSDTQDDVQRRLGINASSTDVVIDTFERDKDGALKAAATMRVEGSAARPYDCVDLYFDGRQQLIAIVVLR